MSCLVRRYWYISWVAPVLFFLCVCVPCFAQSAPYEFSDDGWEGTSELIRVLSDTVGSDNVKPVRELSWNLLRSQDALLIIYPKQPLEQQELSVFLRQGGRVALLDDFGASDENQRQFHLRRVAAPKHPARTLRGNPSLAIATAVVTTDGGAHPVVANLSTVMMNHPSAIEHPQLTATLRIDAEGEPAATVGVAGQVGNGKLFVVSDASVVINQMMRYPGNRQLVSSLGRYLIEREQGADAGGVLYVLAGKFEQSGSYTNSLPLLSSVRRVMMSLKTKLKLLRNSELSSTTALVLGVSGALIAALWVLAAAMQSSRKYVPSYAQKTVLVFQGGVAGRAAVLTAPTTHRALALLELKSSFEDTVAEHFRLPLPVSADQVLRAVGSCRDVDKDMLVELKRWLLMISIVETSIVARKPVRVSHHQIAQASALIDKVIEKIKSGDSLPKSVGLTALAPLVSSSPSGRDDAPYVADSADVLDHKIATDSADSIAITNLRAVQQAESEERSVVP